MSFDLSQLDLVAKGETTKTEEPTPQKQKLKFRPQISRRKTKDVRQITQSISDESRVFVSNPDSIEDPCLETSPLTPPPVSSPVPEGASNVKIRKRKSSKVDLNEGGSMSRRTPKLSRLQQLAELTDIADLPLCDLISRASYLEDQKLQREGPNQSPKHSNLALPPIADPSIAGPSLLAPQVTVVDGKLVVNQDSLELRNHRQNRSNEEYIRVEEGEDRLVNYHSYADWATNKSAKWSPEESELLVQGIGQFGIDFSLLERLFPGRGRKQIKAKFSRMWKEDPEVFGKHFNKKEGETDESYSRLVQDLRSEKLTYKSDDFQTQNQTEEEGVEKDKKSKPAENEDLSYWIEQDFHY